MNHVDITVLGKVRRVFVDERRDDGSYSARVREPYTGNSFRGVLRNTKRGWRFKAAHPELIKMYFA